MRKIPKAGPRRYKHAYNKGYKAGILKGQNGNGQHGLVKTVIQGNTFEIASESALAMEKRAEVAKELAVALGKIADALKGPTHTGLTIVQKEAS